MALPFFYVHHLDGPVIILDEDTSKHMIGVLRMEKGEEVLLTDGKGKKAIATIIDDNRKKCSVKVSSLQETEAPLRKVAIGISLIKNSSRFEWFLEKATEIGVNEFIPLICERTEKEKFRTDRMQNILISAMLQSQQCWLPSFHEPAELKNILTSRIEPIRFIAHCLPQQKASIIETDNKKDVILLVGPEGDFTPQEIETALKAGYLPVSLGKARLRTETAGIVGATLLCIQ